MQDISTTSDTAAQNPLPAENPGWVKTAAVLTAAIGLVVLCGWAFGIEAFKRLLPGMIAMKANAAAAFVLSGICLYLHTLRQIPLAALLVRRIAATLVLLIGLATISEYFFGWDAGIDQLMFSEPAGAILTSHPGRMAAIVAINFALIGGALLLLEARLWVAVQAAAFAVAAFTLMPMGGYMFGNLDLTRIGDTTAIAAHAVLGSLILAAGILTATRNHGLMLRLRRKSRAVGLAASLIMLVFIFGAASYNFAQKDKASQWVEHTYEVIHGIELFSGSMHDFLYHSRGFLITGDDRQLTERDKRRDAMVIEFAALRQLMSGNPAQQERLEILDKLARQRMEQANLAVQLWREKGPKAAAEKVLSGQGEALTREFEAKLDEMREAEKSLLKERQGAAEIVRASSLFTLVVLLAASVLLLLWVFRTSQRELVERKQSEMALRASEERLHTIIETSMDAVVQMDADGTITGWNIQMEKIFGWPRAEAVGRSLHETIIPPQYRDAHVQGLKHYLLSGEGVVLNRRMEVVGLHRDGHLFPVELTVTPLKIRGRYEFSAFLRDISAHKRHENIQAARLRLMESAARLSLKELLVATLDEACTLTGSTIGFYHFLEADQRTLTLQAWSTRTTREFCKAEGEGAHYNIDAAGVWVDCVRERRPVIHNDYAALPNRHGLPPGHAHVEREMVVPIFRNELIVAILGVGNKATPYDDNDLESVTRLADLAWDIAEAKRAEEEVYRLNAELEQRVAERTARLEAANNDMESFSYSISHDLRAPLRAINGFSKILQEEYVDRLDDEGRRLLNVVGGNAQKMGELIDDILAFSRAGRHEVNRSAIDMKKMVAGVWEELGPDMTGRNVHLEMRDMPPIEGDAAMMHQVVFNLLSNAVKFTQHRADARVEVGGQTDEHETVYHIEDNGAGFDMQYADKLFGVFQRLHGMDEFEGTGIGLAIVKRIVAKHGGRVWAEGKVGEGATVYFALPTKGKNHE